MPSDYSLCEENYKNTGLLWSHRFLCESGLQARTSAWGDDAQLTKRLFIRQQRWRTKAIYLGIAFFGRTDCLLAASNSASSARTSFPPDKIKNLSVTKKIWGQERLRNLVLQRTSSASWDLFKDSWMASEGLTFVITKAWVFDKNLSGNFGPSSSCVRLASSSAVLQSLHPCLAAKNFMLSKKKDLCKTHSLVNTRRIAEIIRTRICPDACACDPLEQSSLIQHRQSPSSLAAWQFHINKVIILRQEDNHAKTTTPNMLTFFAVEQNQVLCSRASPWSLCTALVCVTSSNRFSLTLASSLSARFRCTPVRFFPSSCILISARANLYTRRTTWC